MSNLPTVMVLGTYHMANNNLDIVKTNYDNHLSDKRLAEIDDVLDHLQKYKPTHIVLEANYEQQDKFQADYDAYLKDEFELTDNERHLIGFQLAKRCHHENIYCGDSNIDNTDIEMSLGEVYDYVNENGPQYLTDELDRIFEELQNLDWNTLSVIDHLRKLNAPAYYKETDRVYMSFASVMQFPDKYYGADWVGKSWFSRNLRIFAYLSHIAHLEPDARVLMIIGAGHLASLTQYIDESLHLEHVPSVDYLA